MRNKKKSKSINTRPEQEVLEVQKAGRSDSLIFGGVLIAMSSIGLLIFVLSEKIFHLN